MKKHLLIGAVLAGSLTAQSAYAVDTVQVDGSSTVFPVSEAMAEEFGNANRGEIRVTVGLSGTGGGFKKFCRGETDITGASRPIRPDELEQCKENGIKFLELPVAMDALSVVVSPKNDWVDYLTVEELKMMWEPEAQGKINNWNQIRDDFPDRELVLYGAGTDSGTYDYFTAAVVGKEHSSRGDFFASEDDNVLVQGVANNTNALGFFGLAYFLENTDKLKAVPISWKGKDAVEPSKETAGDGEYQPLTRPLYYYANIESVNNKDYVVKFIEFIFDENNGELVSEVGYVPLGERVRDAALRVVADRENGTAYQGSEVGVDVVETLNRKKHY
ncbi:PstS family phosphate ABC transporter substrate-binding protein [Marinobacter sp. ATCH36]|uniref:PstS family phosphate ABC transporter substrate-binding protein n=1 Tax=Marinobacter sp. ATCH36 TaxID=2945106 RepID=UPI00201FE250|nr:PstS family phosphate ABC transporter substrate-binding protein [Marinobacter sp. ATCH36]MCL7943087.1 PstS family phosphate ABC transporter substrate-binding protein [Marinobacter sp. ATCH36]